MCAQMPDVWLSLTPPLFESYCLHMAFFSASKWIKSSLPLHCVPSLACSRDYFSIMVMNFFLMLQHSETCGKICTQEPIVQVPCFLPFKFQSPGGWLLHYLTFTSRCTWVLQASTVTHLLLIILSQTLHLHFTSSLTPLPLSSWSLNLEQ